MRLWKKKQLHDDVNAITPFVTLNSKSLGEIERFDIYRYSMYIKVSQLLGWFHIWSKRSSSLFISLSIFCSDNNQSKFQLIPKYISKFNQAYDMVELVRVSYRHKYQFTAIISKSNRKSQINSSWTLRKTTTRKRRIEDMLHAFLPLCSLS